MSRSIHTSRAKYRKAARFDYSNETDRANALGKIIDEIFLKRDMKENERRKKQISGTELREVSRTPTLKAFASKRMIASGFSMDIAKTNDRKNGTGSKESQI